MNSISVFMSGAVAMGFSVSGLFFFRFWKSTGDRLFAIFGLAFWTMAVEHVVNLAIQDGNPDEGHPLVYIFRLSAFAMILMGIVDKNRLRN